MNRMIRSTKTSIESLKFYNGICKNFSFLNKFKKISQKKETRSLYNQRNLIKLQKYFFSKNDNNHNKKEEGEKNKSENEDKKENSQEKAENDGKKVEITSKSQTKKKPIVNLFLEEETQSINDFMNIDKNEEFESKILEGEKEKSQQEKDQQIKFPLIYNLIPIIPYSRLTLSNLHRNDLFFSLIMKYGRLNLVDEEKNYIEDIAVFFDKEEYLKSSIIGTVCKVCYFNQEKLIVEGLDKMFSIKSDKLGKLKFFYPSENTLITMENEYLEAEVNLQYETQQENYINEVESLYDSINSDHEYILNHLKISNEYFGEYDISFDFNSNKIKDFIIGTPSERKIGMKISQNQTPVELDEIRSFNLSLEHNENDYFNAYLSELFKFSYFYLYKINTFSNLIYNHSEELQNILPIRDLKKRLQKIKESFTNMINLIKLKHVFYQFPTDLRLNFENPFARQTESEFQRILKYKEALENKLSEVDTVEKQKEEFRKKLYEIENMSDETKKVVEKEINKISNTNFETENGKRIEYINHIFALPWDNNDSPEWDLEYCKNILDSNLYGLEETKQRIYEFIAKNMRKNNKKGCVILLTGGPGTGKTRIAKLIGESLKRKVGFISLAGISDGKGILGFKRTYISSTPGVLIKEMQKLGTKNPVIVIDEIDKVNYRSTQSNVYHALLQLLNIEENHRFIDHYLEIPFDFSNVIFVLTSNNEDIFPPLMDRMEVIKVDPYIYYEKFLILKNFAQKQILKDYCYDENNFKITDQALYKLIYEYCKTEAGVRKAKKLLEKLVRKINAKIETEKELDNLDEQSSQKISYDDKIIQINSNNLSTIMNTPKDEDPVLEDMILNSNRYGFCVGLFVSSTNQSNSWGSASIFSLSVREIKKLEAKIISQDASEKNDNDIEKSTQDNQSEKEEEKKNKEKDEKKSKFKISSSGNLGEDSIQSLTIAINIATEMLSKIQPDLTDFFYKNEIHQHVPQVLLPKSGPSAGVVLFLCAMSLALKKNIITNLAMTGEVCIDGTVLKIGGVKEKAQGAQRYGIKTLVIPFSNKYDFLDLPDSLKNTFEKVYFAKHCQEIYNIGFGLETTGIDCYTPSHSIEMTDFIEKEIIEENNLLDLFFNPNIIESNSNVKI